jgi:3-hydroxyisobutyrate dehydrogenase-like beta-hydroxyacid dehydrogenase
VSLARAVDVLALCLRDDQDIRDLIEQHGLLDALRPGATVVNHGTGDPRENERIGAAFAARRVRCLDVPVTILSELSILIQKCINAIKN